MIRKYMALLALACAVLAVDRGIDTLTPGTSKPEEIIILQEGLPSSLDPVMNDSYLYSLAAANIYEGLVSLNPLTMNPEPCIASKWEVSQDGKRWTFYIRPGIMFGDGSPCDAGAVETSMLRAMSYAGDRPYAAMVFAPVESISSGSGEITFVLKYPHAPFLKNLALPFAAPVVSPAALRKYGSDFWRHPSGTGAYCLKQKTPDSIVLEENPYYRKKPPDIKKVTIRKTPSARERTQSLINGKADLIFQPQTGDRTLLLNRGFNLVTVNGMDTGYLGFNTTRKPFNSLVLRKYLTMALDRVKLAGDCLGSEGSPAYSLLPPPLSEKSSDAGLPESQVLTAGILAVEGYPQGLEVTLGVYLDPRIYCPEGGLKLAEGIKNQLAGAGITVNIYGCNWEDHKKAILSGKYDLFLYGWTSDNGDPDNFYMPVFANLAGGAGSGPTGYADGTLDRILHQARSTHDEARRSSLYGEAEVILAEKLPLIPINHSTVTVACQPGVSNVFLSGFGLIDLSMIRTNNW